MLDKLKSRKLWAFVGVTILVLVNSIFQLGISTDDVLYLAFVSASYILGQGYVDAKRQLVKDFPIGDIAQASLILFRLNRLRRALGRSFRWTLYSI